MDCMGMRLLWLCVAGLCSSPSSQAEEALALKGFGTLGLARSSAASAEYVRDLSQPFGLKREWSAKTDSVLGLQADWRIGERTDGVVQVVSRYRYDGSYRPEISWLFVRHDFSPELQVRAGRLGTEFYMLADSRLIGYANLTVRPPPDFYGPLVFGNFDGIDATASASMAGGLLRVKLFAGRSPERTAFYAPVTWDLEGSRLHGGYLDYFTGPWQFRVGSSAVRFSGHELPLNYLANRALVSLGFGGLVPVDLVAQAPELSTVGKTSRFDSIGAVYDSGPLQVHAMLGRINHETAAYEDSRAGFVLGVYRIGRLTPYLGYSRVKSSASGIGSALAPPLDSVVRALVAGTHMDQHTVTLGARWDFQRNWALKAQLDFIRGKPESVFLYRGPDVRWDGRMRVMSVAVDFTF
jgi:hypothetical protein